MHVITIHASIPQIRKLRKGHKVRVKKGKGVHVVVDPETFNLVSRTFDKNKGLELALSEEELEHNRLLSPEEHEELRESHGTGGGIFGKWGDRMLEKAGLKDIAYHIGDKIKPYAKDAILGGLTAGAAGLGAIQPELIPFLAPGVGLASSLANDYLDTPGKYHKDEGKSHMEHLSGLAKSEAKNHANKLINEHLGTNYDYMNSAGLQEAGANELKKHLTNAEVSARKNIPIHGGFDEFGNGLHRHRRMSMSGGALHHHAHRHKNLIEHHTVGTNGGFVSWTPPALVSQPYSANFSMSHMLPPQYVHLNNSVVGHELLHGNGLTHRGGLGYHGGAIHDDGRFTEAHSGRAMRGGAIHDDGRFAEAHNGRAMRGGGMYEKAGSVLTQGRKHAEGAIRNATGEMTAMGRKIRNEIEGNGMHRRRRRKHRGYGLGP